MKYLVTYHAPIGSAVTEIEGVLRATAYHGDQRQIVVEAEREQHAKETAKNTLSHLIDVHDAIPILTPDDVERIVTGALRSIGLPAAQAPLYRPGATS